MTLNSEKKEPKVLLIDPWGINNTSEYLNGLIYGLSDRVNLTVCTNWFFRETVKNNAVIKRLFFRFSEKRSVGLTRKIIRGLEYVKAYVQITGMLKKEQYDIVHFNWLLNYGIDSFFIRRIKKRVKKLVYTVHNVLPHINGEHYKEALSGIYEQMDVLIVHGNSIKAELENLFPNNKGKVYVQLHGCILHEPQIDKDNMSIRPFEKMGKDSKILLCCGAVFYNKGMDRVARIWINKFRESNCYLIIGGKQDEKYEEYNLLKERLSECDNVLLLEGFIDNKILEEYFSQCDAVILPYREASMSGVVFSAAQHKKMVICTNVGALSEYLTDGEDSIICGNEDDMIEAAMVHFAGMDKTQIKEMGERLNKNISEKCDWYNICTGVINNVY